MKQQVENFIYLDALTTISENQEQDIEKIKQQQALVIEYVNRVERRQRMLRNWLIGLSVVSCLLLIVIILLCLLVVKSCGL